MPDRQNPLTTTQFNTDEPRIELRLAGIDDNGDVRRLAALDEERELEGAVLLALLDGHAVAALSMRDGRSVADQFVLTRELVALLRLRAEHLSPGTPAPHRGTRRLRLGALAA
jgi:hypothetical protein